LPELAEVLQVQIYIILFKTSKQLKKNFFNSAKKVKKQLFFHIYSQKQRIHYVIFQEYQASFSRQYTCFI